MEQDRNIRVLMAKPGLDGHERGARVLAYGLRDEGFEVIYTGLRQTPDQIAAAVIQEDVDVVGLSILSGAHLAMAGKVIEKLKGQRVKDVLVLVGGVIPEEDIPKLKEMGVAGVFTSGASIKEIAEFIRSHVS
ncbi:MAG: cobalamin B12-binding domain-containing protein [Syntrophobacterales bacterium]|nr:cobalamin B12-binding domain-containing protein [Syntrophobacterales bacterium]